MPNTLFTKDTHRHTAVSNTPCMPQHELYGLLYILTQEAARTCCIYMARARNHIACCILQQDDLLVARLAMEEGVSQNYMDNDMILLSKDDPHVRDQTHSKMSVIILSQTCALHCMQSSVQLQSKARAVMIALCSRMTWNNLYMPSCLELWTWCYDHCDTNAGNTRYT